jgi:hypothetical protein
MSGQSHGSGFRPTVAAPGDPVPRAVLREFDDWGLRSLDLVRPPGRFWADEPPQRLPVESGVDARRVTPVPTPADLLAALPAGESWGPVGRRGVARLFAHYLIAEDPQRRLDNPPQGSWTAGKRCILH